MTVERQPTSGWQLVSSNLPGPLSLSGSVWRRGKVLVLSSLQLADMPDGVGQGEQWHVSISRAGKRPRDRDVQETLKAFGMSGAEEDNHHPGIARHFWMPIDPSRRVDCECKETEVVVTEPDGYRWTNPTDGGCRGCELAQATGNGCTLHP